jgi:glycosyltransferase involved in cell wall biosynthesis
VTVFLAGRRGARRRLGGDALQIQESADVYRAGGRAVEVIAEPRKARIAAGDVLHLHNIQRVLDWDDLPERARAAGARVFVTPLYHPVGDYHRRGRRGIDAGLAKLVTDHDVFAGLRWGTTRGLRERAHRLLEMADRVFLVHEGERDLLQQDIGEFATPSTVVPVAIPDEAPAAAQGELFSGPFVACVGRIEPLKAPLEVLDAAARANAPIAFVGPPAGARHAGYVARFRAAALAAGRSRVRFLGELPRRDVLALLRRAHAHVLGSWTEVVGRSTLEAAAQGAAVIATDVGFAPRYLEGTPARFVPAGDVDALTEAIRLAMAEPRPGTDGALAERVRRRFTWNAVGPTLLEATR